jgi:hypothetical protein
MIMTTVERLKAEISELSPAEFAELLVWLREYEADEWDRQIERDANAGKLDRLAEEALEAYRRGETTEL